MLNRLAMAMTIVQKKQPIKNIITDNIIYKRTVFKSSHFFHFNHCEVHLIKQCLLEQTVMISDDCVLIISCDNYLPIYLSGIITSFYNMTSFSGFEK